MTALDDSACDPRDVLGHLSLAEHHLGEPLARRPVVIDTGKSEVFDDVAGDIPHGELFGLGRTDTSVTDRFEQPAQARRFSCKFVVGGHGSFRLSV